LGVGIEAQTDRDRCRDESGTIPGHAQLRNAPLHQGDRKLDFAAKLGRFSLQRKKLAGE